MTAEPIQHTHPLLDHRGPWNEAEYLALPDVEGARLELVDGDLLMSPWPANPHQRLVFRLCSVLDRMAPDGYEALPGGNVRLRAGRIVIPDVFLTTIANRTVNDVVDVPLVAEVVSDSGIVRDRILKPLLYADAGVAWYLRVEQTPQLELVLMRLDHGEYVEHARAAKGGRVDIPELRIAVEVDALARR